MSLRAMVDLGLLEKIRFWVFMISRAAAAEEATTTGTAPKWRSIKGPWAWEREWRERWGKVPIWWRLPVIGSFRGEGGGFLCGGRVVVMVENHLRRKTTKRNRGRIEKMKGCSEKCMAGCLNLKSRINKLKCMSFG
ncbi:hypothetical protein Vadar_011587 [Vaccinium darrowii]|uniref:Uncharacterized protein n=1 Tax=Vaccinium darrowii TaxID=229202 RepID=A0ACB7YVS9_9ERIC|nr:hypothetical protein Vadar_011587 [Vaccinium darrowii]